METRWLGALVACVLAATPAAAQAPAAPLTLAAALDEALAQNPTQARLRLDLATARQHRAGEGFLPPPALDAEIWQWPLTTINPLNVNMYMFTIRQEFPRGGKRTLAASVADRDVDAAANAVAVQARDVRAAVTSAFVELALTRRAIAIHEAHVDLLRQSADLTTARYSAGRGEQQDALKAVAEIARLHADLVALDARAQLAAADLNALMNRDPAQPIGDVEWPPALAPLPPLAAVQERALAQRPELAGADIAIQRAQAELAMAKANDTPDVMLMGGYQLTPRTAGAWTAGVGITWPRAPWSRGALDARKVEAGAAVDAARARRQEAVVAVRLAVQQAYIRATSASERARLFDTTVIPQARQVMESSRIAYVADRGTASALVDNQRMVLDAQLEYLQALGDAAQARVDLERAVGAPLLPADAPGGQR